MAPLAIRPGTRVRVLRAWGMLPGDQIILRSHYGVIIRSIGLSAVVVELDEPALRFTSWLHGQETHHVRADRIDCYPQD